MHLIIDSHLDLSWSALSWNRDLSASIAAVRSAEAGMTDKPARGHATVSFPEMRRGGVAVCLATILVRAQDEVQSWLRTDLDTRSQDIAYGIGQGQLAYYRQMERGDHCRLLLDSNTLQQHWQRWQTAESDQTGPLGFILAMEGADPIVEPAQVQEWFDAGLRVVGLAHYGQGAYAYGTGGEGPLTVRGRDLVRELDRAGMILDLTHSSDPSFYEAIDLFEGPVLASHNNCRALVPGDRQFSDEQLGLIIERDGVIGAALDNWMLQAGYIRGETDPDTVSLRAVADQIDHVCQLAGDAGHSAIGSDLDGGFGTEQTPRELNTIADLQQLEAILQARGYSDADIAGIFHGNWLRFFVQHLPDGGSGRGAGVAQIHP